MADRPVLHAAAKQPNTASPWIARPRADLLADLPPFDAASLPDAPDTPPPTGIERRLSNRAEALWNRLRGERRLPPQSGVAALLSPPFGAQAMLVALGRDGRAIVQDAGVELQRMGFVPDAAATCHSPADARLGVGERAVALALQAIAAQRPQHLDSDFDPDIGGARPAILFRAVALPFAPADGSGLSGLAIALVSWRTLLSERETADLHRELRAAIAWMGKNSL